uniref:Uncharacterized protein n=1 Tax=Octopus bimaculoides TaxID=37653 RepID=A0A0L8H1P1_OCTBM
MTTLSLYTQEEYLITHTHTHTHTHTVLQLHSYQKKKRDKEKIHMFKSMYTHTHMQFYHPYNFTLKKKKKIIQLKIFLIEKTKGRTRCHSINEKKKILDPDINSSISYKIIKHAL